MTPIEHLAQAVGSKTALANIIGVHKSQINRWTELPWKYNPVVMRWGAENGVDVTPWLVGKCPCCGRDGYI